MYGERKKGGRMRKIGKNKIRTTNIQFKSWLYVQTKSSFVHSKEMIIGQERNKQGKTETLRHKQNGASPAVQFLWIRFVLRPRRQKKTYTAKTLSSLSSVVLTPLGEPWFCFLINIIDIDLLLLFGYYFFMTFASDCCFCLLLSYWLTPSWSCDGCLTVLIEPKIHSSSPLAPSSPFDLQRTLPSTELNAVM